MYGPVQSSSVPTPSVTTDSKKCKQEDEPQAASKRSKRALRKWSVGDLDALPNELKQASLDCLLPHKQVSFARTSALGLELSNQSVAPLVPFPARVTHSRAIEWTRQFRSLPPQIQSALETTTKFFPCPDIFSASRDDDIENLHVPLYSVITDLRSINIFSETKVTIEILDANLKAAGVPMPNLTINLLAAVKMHLSKGRYGSAKIGLELLEANAKAAGVPVPKDAAQLRQKT